MNCRLLPMLATLALGVSVALRAACATTAALPPGAAGGRVQIWYRSSADCPDGTAFLNLLQGLGRSAALAGVGDRVDFVVTIASEARASSGRLERQSSQRTVTIRDFAAASCAEVAQVLALSLDLALAPEAAAAAEAERATPELALTPSPAPAEATGWQPRLGAQATIETGLAHGVLSGAALFFDLGAAQPGWSARVALRGALGERDAAVKLQLGLVAARLEACWAWSVAELALGPCAGLDLGAVLGDSSGQGGRKAAGFWSSAAAHARVTWQIGRLVAAEGQMGLLVPFVRYDFEAQTGGTVSGSAALGLAAALGVTFRL